MPSDPSSMGPVIPRRGFIANTKRCGLTRGLCQLTATFGLPEPGFSAS